MSDHPVRSTWKGQPARITTVHLTDADRAGLERLAGEHDTCMGAEIREAVRRYLASEL